VPRWEVLISRPYCLQGVTVTFIAVLLLGVAHVVTAGLHVWLRLDTNTCSAKPSSSVMYDSTHCLYSNCNRNKNKITVSNSYRPRHIFSHVPKY
jgi:hypothetical protein